MEPFSQLLPKTHYRRFAIASKLFRYGSAQIFIASNVLVRLKPGSQKGTKSSEVIGSGQTLFGNSVMVVSFD